MALSLWRGLSSKGRRILTIGISFILFTAATFVGMLTPLSAQEMESRKRDLQELRQTIGNMTVLERTWTIFENNFILTLIMFIPFVGPVLGLYIAYNTGAYIGADAAEINPVIVLLAIFILHFAWMEFIAYATAIAGSCWFVVRVFQRKVKRELRNLGTLVLICAALLVLGALIEAVMIG